MNESKKKRGLALLFGIIISLAILELYFRFFYPFPSVIQNGRIYLPTNTSKIIKIGNTPGLSNEVVFSRNSLGLRGADPPQDFENYLSIITLGGSTVESHFQSDTKTWTQLFGDRLKTEFPNVWVNNAGKDGLSTFGQLLMLYDHVVKIKPKVVIFSVGVNDVGLHILRKYDAWMLIDRKLSNEARFDKSSQSGIVTFVDNLWRAYIAKKSGLTHDLNGFFRQEHMVLTDVQKQETIKSMEQSVAEFKNRMKVLIEIARSNEIEPILVTEPSVLGDLVDKTTGVDLGTIKHRDINGSVYWDVLQLYHQALKEVGSEESVFVIDMGTTMPKDSLYFYDAHHYTDEGARKFADLLYEDLAPHLREAYPEFKK